MEGIQDIEQQGFSLECIFLATETKSRFYLFFSEFSVSLWLDLTRREDIENGEVDPE